MHVAGIILSLNAENSERPGRLNPEGGSAQRPTDILLNRGGGFPNTGRTDKEQPAFPAQEPPPQQGRRWVNAVFVVLCQG
jgi:hypothetical protein